MHVVPDKNVVLLFNLNIECRTYSVTKETVHAQRLRQEEPGSLKLGVEQINHEMGNTRRCIPCHVHAVMRCNAMLGRAMPVD
jgi:hypothetical protein